MSRDQRELVADAVRAYKSIRPDLPAATPFWPLGLPRWTDPWIAVGMRAAEVSYLTVWHRGPADDPAEVSLPVPHLRGSTVAVTSLYPDGSPAGLRWDKAEGRLTVSLPRTPTACLIKLASGNRCYSG